MDVTGHPLFIYSWLAGCDPPQTQPHFVPPPSRTLPSRSYVGEHRSTSTPNVNQIVTVDPLLGQVCLGQENALVLLHANHNSVLCDS